LTLRSLVRDNALDNTEASILLSFVLHLVLGEWVLELGILSLGPWESWEVVWVSISRTAGESACGLSVVAIVETKDAKRSNLSVVSLSKVSQSHSKSELVGLRTSAPATEMDLNHA
jgi:hypothetical protein